VQVTLASGRPGQEGIFRYQQRDAVADHNKSFQQRNQDIYDTTQHNITYSTGVEKEIDGGMRSESQTNYIKSHNGLARSR
jgi:hypothetical protein